MTKKKFYDVFNKFSEIKPTKLCKKNEKEKSIIQRLNSTIRGWKLWWCIWRITGRQKNKLDQKFKPINLKLAHYNHYGLP